ncbi:MAG TPA: hypothetical protein VGS62_08240 [Streptosporangiaceae bacterium]|nr:hypothetical protein [Streptosporangiaceae bacterium]
MPGQPGGAGYSTVTVRPPGLIDNPASTGELEFHVTSIVTLLPAVSVSLYCERVRPDSPGGTTMEKEIVPPFAVSVNEPDAELPPGSGPSPTTEEDALRVADGELGGGLG